MCLITGFVNFENSISLTFEILEKLKYRGIDCSGICFGGRTFLSNDFKVLKEEVYNFYNEGKEDKDLSSLVFGHNLHSIVNFVSQPIFNDGNILVSNCEIYNWEFLRDEFNLDSKNDSQLILDLINLKGIDNLTEILDLFEGVYAFSYFDKKKNEITLVRDIIGAKPIFYYFDSNNDNSNKFAFCSERKGLIGICDESNIFELNPRQILKYSLDNSSISFEDRKLNYSGIFFDEKDYSLIKDETFKLLEEAILKMVPKNQKVGLLFSGGIDSTFIAYIFKKNNIDFKAYTAKLIGGKIEEAQDYIFANEISKKYDFKLGVSVVEVKDLEQYVKKIILSIEDTDYIKVSVALPFLLSCNLAKKDNIKVIFSGLGSEELFAGYRRHKQVEDANLECYKGLLTLYNRDLYRDDVICMSQNLEIRLPFLDLNLIDYALQIPVKYKLNLAENRSKIVLRDIAKSIGLDERYCERQKKAAQYGSKFDKGLLRLAKDANLGKQKYLNDLARNLKDFKGIIRKSFE